MEVRSTRSLNSPSAAPMDGPSKQSLQLAAQHAALQNRIIAQIVELSRAAPSPANWSKFGTTEAVRRLPPAGQLLSALQKIFSDDELIAAGAAIRTAGGGLKLSNVLDTRSSVLVLPGEDDEGAEVISENGSLRNSELWKQLARATTDGISPCEVPIVLCQDDAELYSLSRFGIKCLPLGDI